MNDCTCKPGDYDNGWQEVRGVECIRVEMDAWRQVIARGDIVKRLRAEPAS